MGYSIATPVRSHKLKEKMFTFLEEHYRSWSQIMKYEDEYVRGPTDDLSYDQGTCRIGFDYGALGDPERCYIFSILTWISIKVGKRKSFKKIGGSFLYYVYDGFDSIPILFESVGKKEYDQFIVNKYGYPMKTKMLTIEPKKNGKWEKIIKDELQRLDNLWHGTCVEKDKV